LRPANTLAQFLIDIDSIEIIELSNDKSKLKLEGKRLWDQKLKQQLCEWIKACYYLSPFGSFFRLVGTHFNSAFVYNALQRERSE
jgi:hypothetical protein